MRSLEASLEASRRQTAEGTVKTWEDLERYRVVIERTAPACVVELGTFSGKSALWFARAARCPVVTVDLHHQADDHTLAAAGTSVVRVLGDSASPEVAATVRGLVSELAGERQVLLSVDSDHSCDHVLAELELYAPLVRPGGYAVVEDGLLRWMSPEERAHYRGTPLDAIERWVTAHPEWVPDLELEDRFEQTQHPSGWLRRAG